MGMRSISMCSMAWPTRSSGAPARPWAGTARLNRDGNIDTSISALADQVTGRRGGRFQQFTPVWAESEARLTTEGTYPPSWFSLLVIAGLIGAIGILTNSQILVVGAVVVGPGYGAILSLAFGVSRRDASRMARSAAALAIGFTLAVLAALLLSLVVRWAGLAPAAYTLGVRPVSNLIDAPNWFSFLVAALAGVVGVISLTEARSSTIIGVFISVTTIPAASDISVFVAFGSWTEAWGSAVQLALNVSVLTAVAILGLRLSGLSGSERSAAAPQRLPISAQ
jgi:uncharacterized hydrophobic protein (TIGR00271 family)